MESLWQDIRYAVRILRKNPAFTTTVILLLALGIGANAAIYNVVDAVVLQPLPGKDPRQLVHLFSTAQKAGTESASTSYPIFQDYRRNLTTFSGIAAYRAVALQVSQQEGIAQRVPAEIVSGNFFDVLGIDARYGRLLSTSDDGARGTNPVVVLSERYWRQQFDGRPDTVGSTVRINGQSYAIVGIAPAAVQEFERDPQIWLPMSMAIQADPVMATQIDRISNDFFKVVGRLKPNVSISQAQAELTLVAEHLGAGRTTHLWSGMDGEVVATSKTPPGPGNLWEEYDWVRPWARLAPLEKGFSPEEGRLSWLLLCVAGLVLLIAIADVAGLLLVRAEYEEKEIAIRASLGASRWVLLRQKIVQGLLLAFFGAIAALFASSWAAKLLFASAPEGLPLPVGIASSSLTLRVVLFVLAISTVAGIAFCLLPNLKRRIPEIAENLQRQSSSSRSTGLRMHSVLVVGQIVASVVLLVGASLLLQTMRNVAHIDLGFDTDHVLSASVDFSRQGYTKEQGAAMLQPLLEKLQSMPGNQSVALVAGSPVIWRPRSYLQQNPVCSNLPMTMVSPGYFQTLQIPFAQGRDFTVADGKSAPGVVIVNQAAAKLCWPDENPLGRSFKSLSVLPKPFEIIGIAGNIRVDEDNTNPRPQIYTPVAQFYDAFPWQFSISVLVRTTLPPHSIVSSINSGIRSLDSNLLLYDVQTPRELLARAFAREQFFTRVLGIFAVLALTLAITGLHGLLAYITVKRSREFAIRMALGAVPREILRLVLTRGAALSAVGITLGLLAALGVTRFLQSVLFGVKPTDTATFAGVAAAFLGICLLACLVPARRATSTDPMQLLREE
jgi:predicted permease